MNFPPSRLTNLDEVVDILGVLVDGLYMHFNRTPILATPEKVPQEWDNFMHVCDAEDLAYTREDMIHTARDARLYPGEGAIDFWAVNYLFPDLPLSIELPRKAVTPNWAPTAMPAAASRLRAQSLIDPRQLTSLSNEFAMARDITTEEIATVDAMLDRARKAMDEVSQYDQAQVDRLARAHGWACGNGDLLCADRSDGRGRKRHRRPRGRAGERWKTLGVLQDALRGKSVGVIEEDTAKGITKIAKPAGVIASLIPTTNPELAAVTGIYAIKCKDAVIFRLILVPRPRPSRWCA